MSGPWEDYQPATEPGAKATVSGPWEKYGAAPVSAPAPAAITPPPASSGAAPSELDSAIAAGRASDNPIVRGGASLADIIQRSPITGAVETGLSAGGNLIGKIASGIAGIVTGGNADVVRGVQDATRYIPQTQGSRDIAALGAQIMRPAQAIAAPVDKAIANAGPGVSTFVPAAFEAAQDLASILPVGLEGRAASAAAKVEGAAKPSIGAPLDTARGAGYVARPSDVRATGESPPGLVREAMVNSTGLGKKAALQNQPLTTKLAGDEMGVPNAKRLTDADYDKFRANGPGKVYDATAQMLGDIPADTNTVSNLNSIAANPNPASAIPAKAAANVTRIAKKIESGSYTGANWRTDVGWLRANGARDAADELEDMAMRSLAATGQTPQVTAFQGAREQFAKSYDYQGATAQRGQVDAHALAALDAKYPNKLTGNAKIIATAGRTMPDVTGVPGGGINDMATTRGHGVTGVLSAAHQVVGGLVSKLPGMNPLAPSFQARNFGRTMTPTEKSYVPDFGRKGAGPTPFAPRMDLTAPPGPPEGAPQQLGMTLAQGRPAAPGIALTPPEGNVGVNPSQLGMALSQGRAPAPPLDLAPPPGNVGVNPVQNQADLRPPQKRLGDILAPADERRLKRTVQRREGTSPPGGPNKGD